ncbi:Werner Syndrome-like exonuclease [Senna tora]|uniref:Werner Syndrome-like exonuclease n=1 Tax=Senna tora TaxID=362788 RepID=A0A834X4P3_9FABA|nr:Werner Syndrome-like exonuclease [Senna tora]
MFKTLNNYSTITFDPTTSKYTVKYNGKSIETTVTDKGIVADEWVQEIYSKFGGNSTVVGLDVEWRPTFIRDTSNKAATLQLCIDDKCLILQLFYMDYFPSSLKRKSQDMREVAKMKWPGRFCRPGLKDLAMEVANVYMKKPKHVCMSNWEARILSEQQVEYGCMDAFASYSVGHKLQIGD